MSSFTRHQTAFAAVSLQDQARASLAIFRLGQQAARPARLARPSYAQVRSTRLRRFIPPDQFDFDQALAALSDTTPHQELTP